MKAFFRAALILSLLLNLAAVIFAQEPELVVQTGHNRPVLSVAFSPDGKTLASASEDIKLWDVATGAQLRALQVLSQDVYSLAFSPDGKTLASGSNDGKVELWDITTGALLRSFEGDKYRITSLAFSPDGKTLAGGSGDIRLWDVATGARLRSLGGNNGMIESMSFSPDGKTLAGSVEFRSVEVWDVTTGALLRAIKVSSQEAYSLAFSPDGKTFAGGSKNGVTLQDSSTGKQLRSLQRHAGGDVIRRLAFSPDGKTLAGTHNVGEAAADMIIELWDVTTGALLRSLPGHTLSIESMAFSPDGKTLAGGSENAVTLWDVSAGKQLLSLRGRTSDVRTVAFSPDGKTLVSADDTVKLWDISTGQPRFLQGYVRPIFARAYFGISVAFSPDSKTLATACPTDTVKLWDVTTGTQLRPLEGDEGKCGSVAFSPDGQTLAAGCDVGKVTLWDVSTGKQLRTMTGHTRYAVSLAFSPDGKALASGSYDGTVKLWNVSTGQLLYSTKEHASDVWSIALSPDGKVLASGGLDTLVVLSDVATSTPLRSLRGHAGPVCSVAFSPDGKTLASASSDKTLKLWDVKTGTQLRSLERHGGFVASVAFSPGGKILASGSADGTVKLWEPNGGEELSTLISIDKDDWAVVAPGGLFDGSPAAWNKIIWRAPQNTFDYAPVEAYFGDFFYPGLLTDVFSDKQPRVPHDLSKKDRRQPQLRLTLSGGQLSPAAVSTRTVAVKVEVAEASSDPPRPAGSGAKDVRLFRNGSLVKVWHGDVLKGEPEATLEATVPVVTGENRFTAYAFNRDNVKSADAGMTVQGADSLKRAGTLYLLAVGVNRYANAAFNLTYAVPDAEEFGSEIKRQQDRLGNYQRTEVISLYDERAKKGDVMSALAALGRKAQPEDAVVVYFAGHGTVGSCGFDAARLTEAQERFYLVPHDLGYTGLMPGRCDQRALDTITGHSISDEELEAAFEGMDAGKVLLVIDACNSGQALESEEKRRGPMNSKGLAQLAYEKGMYVLTASQGFQLANESRDLGHGYLTYALINEGIMQARADAEPRDGSVLIREWLNYVAGRVPQIHEEQRRRQEGAGQVVLGSAANRSLRLVRRDDLQRPRVFYRRELEGQPLVVAKPGAEQSK